MVCNFHAADPVFGGFYCYGLCSERKGRQHGSCRPYRAFVRTNGRCTECAARILGWSTGITGTNRRDDTMVHCFDIDLIRKHDLSIPNAQARKQNQIANETACSHHEQAVVFRINAKCSAFIRWFLKSMTIFRGNSV